MAKTAYGLFLVLWYLIALLVVGCSTRPPYIERGPEPVLCADGSKSGSMYACAPVASIILGVRG